MKPTKFDKFIAVNYGNTFQKSLRRVMYMMTSAKHIGQSYSEFREMPIPVILMILNEYNADMKAEAAARKKQGKR